MPIATTSSSPAVTLPENEMLQLVPPVHDVTGVAVCAIPGIVNVFEAVSDPPSLPVATTEYTLGESEGTVKVHEKAPVAEVVCEVQVWVPGVAPPKVKVEIAVLGVYPLPVTVMPVVPAAAFEEDRAIAGVVIVNVVDAVSDPPSLPVATMVYDPAASDGTVKVQLNVPVADVV